MVQTGVSVLTGLVDRLSGSTIIHMDKAGFTEIISESVIRSTRVATLHMLTLLVEIEANQTEGMAF